MKIWSVKIFLLMMRFLLFSTHSPKHIVIATHHLHNGNSSKKKLNTHEWWTVYAPIITNNEHHHCTPPYDDSHTNQSSRPQYHTNHIISILPFTIVSCMIVRTFATAHERRAILPDHRMHKTLITGIGPEISIMTLTQYLTMHPSITHIVNI
jgi:hypothetical protein